MSQASRDAFWPLLQALVVQCGVLVPGSPPGPQHFGEGALCLNGCASKYALTRPVSYASDLHFGERHCEPRSPTLFRDDFTHSRLRSTDPTKARVSLMSPQSSIAKLPQKRHR
jgi:hypothetical protein